MLGFLSGCANFEFDQDEFNKSAYESMQPDTFTCLDIPSAQYDDCQRKLKNKLSYTEYQKSRSDPTENR